MKSQFNKLNFIENSYEKVLKLIPIIKDLNSKQWKGYFALKGGTSINLTLLQLPRLSIDIDLDFTKFLSKEEMQKFRQKFEIDFLEHLKSKKLTIQNLKQTYSLTSFIVNFRTQSNAIEKIKIEINWSLRCHIMPLINTKYKDISTGETFNILTLEKHELFASKLSALLNRAKARDLYDVNNLIKMEWDINLLRKCTIFYSTVGSSDININFDSKIVDSITKSDVKRTLLFLLGQKERCFLVLDEMKANVKSWLDKVFDNLTVNEKKFIECFQNKEYKPELLFDDKEIVERIKNHPMALWKTRK